MNMREGTKTTRNRTVKSFLVTRDVTISTSFIVNATSAEKATLAPTPDQAVVEGWRRETRGYARPIDNSEPGTEQ